MAPSSFRGSPHSIEKLPVTYGSGSAYAEEVEGDWFEYGEEELVERAGDEGGDAVVNEWDESRVPSNTPRSTTTSIRIPS